jgi:hypothetical protein
LHYAEYVPGPFERLCDVLERSSHARDSVQLLFLVKVGVTPKTSPIPRRFEVSPKSRYQTRRQAFEIDYRIYDTELRMEFYLSLLDLFVLPREIVLSVFGGGKIVSAAWVRIFLLFSLSVPFNSNRVEFL